MSARTHTILVTNGTGKYGRAVIRALLKTKMYNVRVFVPKRRSPISLELQLLGCEVVKGDINNKESVERAMLNCYGVVVITSTTDGMSITDFDLELRQGRLIADGAKNTNVKHLIFCGSRDISAETNGQIQVRHTLCKARIEDYIRGRNLPFTFIHPAWVMENLLTYRLLNRSPDGWLLGPLPAGQYRIGLAAIKDVARCVADIFLHSDMFLGKTVPVCSDYLSGLEMSAIIAQETGLPCKYEEISLEAFARLPLPEAAELAQFLAHVMLYDPHRGHKEICAQMLPRKTGSFARWLHSESFTSATKQNVQ